MIRPLGRDRWSFLYNNGGDSLVHSVVAMYATKYEQRDEMIVPVCGITECGVFVRLLDNHVAVAEQGVYLDDKHTVTCIFCASGVCKDGISFRQRTKNMSFSQRYHYPIQGSAADFVVLDEVMDFDYSALEQKILESYSLKSIATDPATSSLLGLLKGV